MLTFKSSADLAQLDPCGEAHKVMQELVELLIVNCPLNGQPYDPEEHGYLVLVEPGDLNRELNELGLLCRLSEIPWESAQRRGDFIFAVYLGTDEFGMGFLIPDESWVDGEFRAVLEEMLESAGEAA